MSSRIMTVSLTGWLVVAATTAHAEATRVFVNGTIITMDGSNRIAQAVAIDGKRIVGVGSDSEIRKLAGPHTEIVELGGRTVIPGLIDGHLHAIRGGPTFNFETYWYDVDTLEAALSALSAAASRKGVGRWVAVAGSWSPEQFAERRAPTVDELDRAAPNNPVYL